MIETVEIPAAVIVLIPALVGWVAVPLINALKKLINPTGENWVIKIGTVLLAIDVNLLIAVFVSLGLALLALIITNQFSIAVITPATIVYWIGLTFSVATLIYKQSVAQKKAKALQ